VGFNVHPKMARSTSTAEDGTIKANTGKGVPQGGVISPLLSNLYMHYCVDKWLEIYYPNAIMIRYADDLIIHCSSHAGATQLLSDLTVRLRMWFNRPSGKDKNSLL